MDSTWIPYGMEIFHKFHIEWPCIHSIWIPGGFQVDSIWIPCGFHVDSIGSPCGIGDLVDFGNLKNIYFTDTTHYGNGRRTEI